MSGEMRKIVSLVSCSRCGAQRGQACRARNGNPQIYAHQSRLEAFLGCEASGRVQVTINGERLCRWPGTVIEVPEREGER